MALAVFAAAVYVICAREEVRKQLGVSISHVRGGVHIIRAVACYGDEFVVPERIELAQVTHISSRAFDDEKNSELQAIYIPAGITYIGESVFGERDILPEIRFEGTEEQWKDIEKHTDFSGAVIFFDVPCPKPVKRERRGKQRKDRGESHR